MRDSAPGVGFVKFTLTPQSTLINTTAAYKQHTVVENTEAPPAFLFPLSHTESETDTSMCERNNKQRMNGTCREGERQTWMVISSLRQHAFWFKVKCKSKTPRKPGVALDVPISLLSLQHAANLRASVIPSPSRRLDPGSDPGWLTLWPLKETLGYVLLHTVITQSSCEFEFISIGTKSWQCFILIFVSLRFI